MDKFSKDLDAWITREQPVQEEPVGLICAILENKRLGNCSLNGISKRCNEVTVIVKQASVSMWEATTEAPAVKIVKRFLAGRNYYHVQPIDGEGYMFGGTYIKINNEVVLEDGEKIIFDYPLPFHDRQEPNDIYGGD